jgi:hypothetical protein
MPRLAMLLLWIAAQSAAQTLAPPIAILSARVLEGPR